MSEESSTTQLEQLTALAVSLHASPNDLQPRLLPGRIPEDCPLQIPVPPHSRLLGTMAHSHRIFVIMLQCDLPLNEALSWCRTQLAALNWKERGEERVWPGERPTAENFWSDGRPSVRLEFRHFPSHALICHAWVTLMEQEDATTLVRLHMMLNRVAFYQVQPEQPAP